MKEIVVTNGLRVRSEGIAAPHKSIRLSGIKKSIQEKFVFIFCCCFFNVLSFFCLFFHSSGKSFADIFTPSVQDLVMMHLKTLLKVF